MFRRQIDFDYVRRKDRLAHRMLFDFFPQFDFKRNTVVAVDQNPVRAAPRTAATAGFVVAFGESAEAGAAGHVGFPDRNE